MELRHQISNAFIRFVVEPKATPGAHYQACTTRPSGATLAAFFARGVTPCVSREGACARVLHTSNRQQQKITSSRSYRFIAVAHELFAIAMTTSKRPVESFFFTDIAPIITYIFIILPSFFPQKWVLSTQ
jgi:hypothetical protein